MERSATGSPDPDLTAEAACSRCERPVGVTVPDGEVEPAVSPYVDAFGDRSVVHSPAGLKFWAYYR